MKKTMMSIVFAAVATAVQAVEPTAVTTHHPLPSEVRQSLVTLQAPRGWFGYVRMGLTDSRPTDVQRVLPDLGVGARCALPVGALDVSVAYSGTDAFAKDNSGYFYTLPRVSYLYYVAPTREQSLYVGSGLAYGGLKTKDATSFDGAVASVSLGYEMNRWQDWRSFVQLDVSQPVLFFSKERPFAHFASASLGPIAELSLGFGY